MAEIKVEKTVFQKYAEFKVEFGKQKLNKSGHNAFQGFDYFELGDFSNQADELLAKHELVYIEPTQVTEDGIPYFLSFIASYDGVQKIPFKVEIKESNSSKNPVQNSGATITYYRRYLKGLAIGLLDRDEVDSVDNSKNEPKQEPKATKGQVEKIKELYDEENIAKITKFYQVDMLEQLTLKQASQVVAKKDKNNG